MGDIAVYMEQQDMSSFKGHLTPVMEAEAAALQAKLKYQHGAVALMISNPVPDERPDLKKSAGDAKTEATENYEGTGQSVRFGFQEEDRKREIKE